MHAEFHGTGGPLNVADLELINPLTRAFLAGAKEIGLAENTGFQRRHAGWRRALRSHPKKPPAPQRGRRVFAAGSASPQSESRIPGSRSCACSIENGRAVGRRVSAERQNRRSPRASEVILAGGTINSPQLLLLSGIGPADQLARFGIPAVHDLPGVGANLQDHPDGFGRIPLHPAHQPGRRRDSRRTCCAIWSSKKAH